MIRRVCILGSFILLSVWQKSLAVTYPLPPEGSRLVGAPLTIQVPEHNTQPLETFAAQYGQGLSNMLEANPVLMFFYRNQAQHWSCRNSLFFRQQSVRGWW